MASYIFDIEANELLIKATKCWIIAVQDIETGHMQYWLEGELGWREVFNEADMLIGHNILSYDLPLLKKLFNYDLPDTVKVRDTLIMSQVLDYMRFGYDGHSLAVWGQALEFPKGEFSDFSKYSEEMLDYCLQDIRVNKKVYEVLLEEFNKFKEISPLITTHLMAEHAAAKWTGLATMYGWPFDLKAANNLMEDLIFEMGLAEKALSKSLGMKAVAKDKVKGEVDVKYPKWIKKGCYNSHTANWFDIDPWNGFYDPDEDENDERLVVGPYCRVTFEDLKLSSVSDVKIFLFRNGWEPDEWNYKRDEETNERIQTSPKITESSLEFLGGNGKLYTNYLTASSRYNILKTWMENIDKEGNLHGDCMTVGTPSMRARHSIIVNVPSVDSPWGKEMRSLFICKPGWKIVGADSSGNQARGLAHYLQNEEFIDVILNGDIHTYNKDALTKALKAMKIDYEVTRAQAKRILYAFLFGASGGKLWSYIFGSQDKTKGNKLKKEFLKAVPGFKELIDKLSKIYGKTSQDGFGYIPSLSGNRIYVDSFHKLLVYLLQSAEKITCSAAIMLAMKSFKKANLPYIPLIFMHDEFQVMVPEERAEQAARLSAKAFKEGPELFGITIMDGEAKIGDSWYDTH